MTRKTRQGSDPEALARILKEHDRRLSAVERRKNLNDNTTESSGTENGIIIESNVKLEVYEDDENEPVSTHESHNLATDYCDKWLATAITGNVLDFPDQFELGTGDEINGELTQVGSTPIAESYESRRDAVFVGELDSLELNGHTLSEIGVSDGKELFNHAPIEPPIEKSQNEQVRITVTFLFLHE